jgi:murein DD-endopeptidase MepM/ murein hydrolase activator NlpD
MSARSNLIVQNLGLSLLSGLERVVSSLQSKIAPNKEKWAICLTTTVLACFVILTINKGTQFLSDQSMLTADDRASIDAPFAFLQDDPASPDQSSTLKTPLGTPFNSSRDTHPKESVAIAQLEPKIRQSSLTVGRGDVLMNMLVDDGANRQDAYYAIESLSKIYSPRKLRAGQTIIVTYETPLNDDATALSDVAQLTGLDIKTDVETHMVVNRTAEGAYDAEKILIALQENYSRAGGTIDSSLYLAALDAGIPDAVIVEMIALFSYDIDFQREIRKGDDFEVYFTRLYDAQGNPVKTGTIHYASMTVQGKQKGYYRFNTPDDKITDYYDAKGQSAKKFLMRTPINGARISSGFGRRKHPVLGYQKAHKGTDFAAPTGTPIMAAGNGTIERSSRYGSYGNYVRIRHANGYQTAYAHMSKYGRGIKAGVKVKQGQTIGYVGATGRVTGAHLHYEVMKDGTKVNPLKIKVPTGRKLAGEILTAFKASQMTLDTQIAALPDWRTVRTVEAETEGSVSAN